MNQEELTKTVMMISNLKKIFAWMVFMKKLGALSVKLKFPNYQMWEKHINPYKIEIFLYTPWRPKVFSSWNHSE